MALSKRLFAYVEKIPVRGCVPESPGFQRVGFDRWRTGMDDKAEKSVGSIGPRAWLACFRRSISRFLFDSICHRNQALGLTMPFAPTPTMMGSGHA
jgi:hypothetical protein